MDGVSWIREQLAGFRCAACGGTYRADRIRVLAHREELFFVGLDCPDCDAEAVAIVSLELDVDASSPGRRLSRGDLEEALEGSRTARDHDKPSVDAADILAMHEFLRGFDGDFRRLFEGSRGWPPGPGGA